MTIPTVYKWTDANAPVLSGTAGSLIALLTACLVDGYGEKAEAGWERTFVNAGLTIASFRNIAGNGKFLRINEATCAENQAYIQGYETMTDETAGTGPFYPLATTTLIAKSSAVGSASRAWVVVANDKAFWLYFFGTGTDLTVSANPTAILMFFGDFKRIGSLEEGFNTVLGIGYAASWNTYGFLTSQGFGAMGDGKIVTPRNITGAVDTMTAVQCIFGGLSNLTLNTYVRSNPGPAFDGTQLVLGGPFYLVDSGSKTDLRGWYPGLFLPIHTFASFTPLQQIQVDARTFLSLPFYYYNDATHFVRVNVFIELGVDWHA